MQLLVFVSCQHTHAKNVCSFLRGKATRNGRLEFENSLKARQRTPGRRDDSQHTIATEADGLPPKLKRLTLRKNVFDQLFDFGFGAHRA